YPKLKRKQTTSQDQEVQVIVQLSEEPVALEKGKQAIQGNSLSAASENSIRAKINSQQLSFEKGLKQKDITYKKGYTFSDVFNGMALTVKASQLDKLLGIDGVVSIDPDEKRYALETPKKDDT